MSKQSFTVGDWRVEPELNRISQGDEHVVIRPKVMDLLVYLSDKPGDVVSVDDIIDDVWDGVIVTSQAVYNGITELRQALGAGGNQSDYIETIPKRGYRLTAPVAIEPGPAEIEPKESIDAPADQPNARSRQTARQFLWPALTAALVALVIGSLFWLARPPSEIEIKVPDSFKAGVLPNSVAVLPFANLSPDPDDAYFAAGIHEEVLVQLSKIKDISVIARTTMEQYAETDVPVPEIAAELRVGAVMEGSVRYAGDRVRIGVQLISAKTGAQLWSQTYDGDKSDIFSFQSDIAIQIATALDARFTETERAAIEAPPTDNPEAYTHYLRSMKIFQTYLPVQAAIEEMDKAIELDPEFAAAYAARAWQRGVLVTVFPGKSLRADNLGSNKALAQADAERALALDPTQARAIAAMVMLALTELRFADAVNLAEQAYQMSPNDTWPVLTYSVMRRFQGRTEETMRLHARLTALDPGRPTVQGDAVSAAWWLGAYETALIHARRTLAIGPDLWLGHLKLAMALTPLGEHEEAVKHADQAIAIMGDSINVKSLAVLIDVYHKAGASDKVAAIIAQVEDLSTQSYTLPCLRFRVYLGAGDGENAMKWLVMAHEREEISLYCMTLKGLNDHPIFDSIRDHPRFEEFVNKGQDFPRI